MTDIAKIGIEVSTTGIEKGVTALNKLQQAASGVTTTSMKMAGTIEAANASISASAVQVAKAELLTAESTLKRIRNRQSATKEDKAAAMQSRDNAKLALAEAQAQDVKAQALLRAAAAQKSSIAQSRLGFAAGSRVSTSGTSGSGGGGGPTLAVNNGLTIANDMMPNRFNTANIAAQFQDIGVTAAMGMNPLIIAMQQGTQVAAIMNSMQSPLAGLKAAFVQVLNPVSLLSIALVGIVAAGLQMIDWAKVGKAALDALASTLAVIAQGLTVVAGAFAVAVTAVGLYNGAMALAVLTTVAGRAALLSQLIALRATATAWALSGVAAVKAAYAAIIAWAAAAAPITLITVGITALIAILGLAAAAFDKLFGTDLLASVKQGVNWMIGAFIGAFKGIGAAADALWNKILRKDGPTDMAKAFGQAFGKSMDTDWLGAVGGAVKKALTPSAGGGIGGAAGGAAQKDPYAEIVEGAKRRIETLKAEQAALGMTEEQAARLRYQTELLNEANQKGLELSPKQLEALMGYGAEMAAIESQTKRQAAAMDFAKDASRGFFNDMKQGLQEGKGLWESFGNAVTNVLSKIFDKIMNSGIEMLYDGLFPSGSGGITGGSGILADIGSFLFSAKGNAFNSGGVAEFAKGGAFTNSIVNRTTPFAFAGGGAFGVMGEAGPEAVMPLHRGPDGSLGVKMNGSSNGGGTAVIININNNSNSQVSTQQRQTSQGMEIDVMIDQMVSQKISEQGSDVNRSLGARDNRRLIQR